MHEFLFTIATGVHAVKEAVTRAHTHTRIHTHVHAIHMYMHTQHTYTLRTHHIL